jgi:hypothetical protein
MKTKNLFQQLLPEVKTELNISAKRYNSAKRLKYVLMSKDLWCELGVDQLRDLTTFANPDITNVDRYTYDSMLFGNGYIKKNW